MNVTCSTVHWIRPSDKIPDDDLSVLLCTAGGLVEQGFRSDGEWFWACAASVDEEVVAWADRRAIRPSRKRSNRNDTMINLFQDEHDGSWVVWTDPEDGPRTGRCIGCGKTQEEALQEAKADLESEMAKVNSLLGVTT